MTTTKPRTLRILPIIGLAVTSFMWASAALAQANPAISPLGIVIPNPEIGTTIIPLPGRVDNAAPETWTRLDTGLPPGVAPGQGPRFPSPEIWVHNVSHATLRVFLPKPSTATGAAIIVAPGSAFTNMPIDREGYRVARRLADRGIVAFVLKYRLAPMPAEPHAFFEKSNQIVSELVTRLAKTESATPIDAFPGFWPAAARVAEEDGRNAIRYVREHATSWHIAPDKIGIMGFSAGGTLALGTAYEADPTRRPDLLASIYGILPYGRAVPPDAPPAFLAVAANDPVAATSGPAVYAAWRAAGASAELHVFEDGSHGFGLIHQGKTSDQWADLFDAWLVIHGFERRGPHLRPADAERHPATRRRKSRRP